MSLRICANGHITGMRKCGMCGTDAGAPIGQQPRPASMNRSDRRRLNAQLDREGVANYDRSRRETRVGSGPMGPNKVANIP